MEYLYEFASSVSRDWVCGAVNELRYPFCFNNFLEDLEKEQGNLIVTRDSVHDRVAQAKKQTRKTAEVVGKWLKDANTDVHNTDDLLKKARAKKSCCLGHCPSWIWRYRLGKKLAKKIRDVKTCIKEGRQYIQIERLASLNDYFSSEECWEFDSRKSACEELMEALKDDEVTMVGLYGMGGCGKTTLAMEVRRRLNHLFDKVLFVPVSNIVEVQRIQGKIASSLQLDLQERDEMDRAQRLCMRLAQEDRILVILDDLWQRLDFDTIGIPSSQKHKGCKVLITTRSEAVCSLMDCRKKIHLSILTDEEAWPLFQKQAHISEDVSNTLQHLARQISNECRGLPVAIAAVAGSLKGKAEVEWKVALDRLRNSKPVNIEKGLPNPYNCLQLSYDCLDIEEAKSLFLLCSVFPEDYEIPVEDLTRSAIGLGLVGEVRSYEGARNEVSAAKNKLISSCLFLDIDEGKCVKMHDLVRNVAHWIAKNENKVIECALGKDVTLEHSSIRYLWCENFPNELDSSNLEFLCIHSYLDIPDEIIKGMGKLRVLFLYNKARERRPLLTMSFKSLPSLHCLLLSKWELGDTSFLGDIKGLESLTLRDCSFLELPDVVVTQLTNLRLLDLSECDIKGNPFEVIGRHPQLEELHFADRRPKWDFDNEYTAEFFKKFSVPQTLQRYQIQFGILFAGFQEEFLNRHRTLFLSYLDTSNAAVRDLAQRAEVLCIAGIHGGAKNVIPDIFQIDGGMNELIELLICDSEDIEWLVDTNNYLSMVGALFSKLLWLRIERMKHLGALCHGPLPASGLFEKLEDLYLSHCPKLTALFTPAIARSLVKLEKLEILCCPGLQHILIDDDKDEISIEDDHRLLFSKVKRLCIRECDNLKYVIPVTFAQGLVQLECLEIVCNRNLKYLFGQRIHGEQLIGQGQNELKIELSALEELTLINLPEMISICPEVCYPTWPSLRLFSLQNCPEFSIVSINTCMAIHNNQIINEASRLALRNIKEVQVKNCELEGIFQLAGLSIERDQDPLTSSLQKLYLENLPQLRYICSRDVMDVIQFMNLQNLQQMEVSGCKKLKSIFSACIVGDLPQLKALKIENCNQLDQIVEDKEYYLHARQNSGSFNMPSLTKLTLKSCPMLGTLFTASTAKTLTSLEELMIQDCHGLKHILTYGRAHKNKGEEIVQDDPDFQSNISVFPSLKKLSIMRCDLLQHIFPISCARDLVKLEAIEITETPELRYVFGQNIRSSHQYQNKIQIELPVLEKVTLHRMPNMIGICPDNYRATCSSLQMLVMNDVGLSTLSINNLMVDSGATQSDPSSERDSGATSTTIEQKLVSVIVKNSSKMEGIFHQDEFPINGQEVISWLEEDLTLVNLPKLSYIWRGAKHFGSLQHLHKLHICNCPKLKVIFSACVLRSLPLLKILVVKECEELEHIIEEDEENENVPNRQSPKIRLSQLKLLLVTRCNNLRRLLYISLSHEFPELEYLIVNQDSHLVQVFEGELGVREGRVEVLLPKLKHVILMQLPNLSSIYQGIEFQTVTNLLVHDCPKLSLTSRTTVEDMLKISVPDKEIHSIINNELHYTSDNLTEEAANKDLMPEATSKLQMSREDQVSSESELPSSQVSGYNQSMLGNFPGSVHEHSQIESEPTQFESYEFLASERKNEGAQNLQSLEHKLPPILSPKLTENIEETDMATTGEVSASGKLAISTSVSELRRPSLTSFETPLHKIPSHKQSSEDRVKESLQEGSTSEEAMKATLSAGVEGVSLVGVVANHTDASGWQMLAQDSQVVRQGDKLNKGKTRTSPCQKTQNGVDSIQKGFNLTDKAREIGVASNESIAAQRNEEPENEFIRKVSISKIPAIATSLIDSELVGSPSSSPMDIPLHKTHSNELVEGQSPGELCLKNQHKTLGETQSTIEITQSVKRDVEEETISKNAKIVASSTYSEPASSQSGPLVTSQRKPYPHSETRHSKTETSTDIDSEDHPMYVQDFPAMEEDDDGQISTPSVSVAVADNLVAKVLANLEEYLKIPLKDLACSEPNSLRLLIAFNFLSRLPLEDVTLSDGLKAIIDSMHKEFPSILRSFKQAFATTNKFAVLEAPLNEVATTLGSKISKAKNFMDEAQQKEAILKEQIIRLEKEIKDSEAELSSLQEEKKKRIAKIIGYKMEFENVTKDKYQMVEDQRKARQELFEVDYRWSVLCSQFEHIRIAAINPS